MPQKCYKRRGVGLIWFALFGMVMIGFVGLAIETSYLVFTGIQLQASADAAALAGAAYVKIDLALSRNAAQRIASENKAANQAVLLWRNEGNGVDGDIVFGRYDRDTNLFDPAGSPFNAVKVNAPRTAVSRNGTLPLLFGPVFGVDFAEMSRTAIAMQGGTTGAGIIALDPVGDCSLEISGNDDLILTKAPGYDDDAVIHVNSSSDCALCGNGSSLVIDAPVTNVYGDSCFNGGPTLTTDLRTGVDPIADPLAGLPAPAYGTVYPGKVKTGGLIQPGYYPDGIRLTSSQETLILEPGIYVLDGEGLYINGGNIIANEVMFYIIGVGSVYLGGNGVIDITPSTTPGGPYEGTSIFQAVDNTNEATIIGTSDMNLEGTFYFPRAKLSIGGNGMSIGNQVISWQIDLHGTGEFSVAYDGRNPAQTNEVYLVR